MKLVTLSKLTGVTPLYGFNYAYQLPSDRLQDVFSLQNRATQYRIVGDQLHTNSEDFKMEYQFEVAEEYWPKSFTLGVGYSMAAVIARAVLEDEKMAKRYDDKAEEMYKIARRAESQASQSERIDDSQFLLTAVRG
jgi:hypothetical protein